jgi:WD40 repeat protein
MPKASLSVQDKGGDASVKPRLRIFVSSPGDVKAAREIAALTIERLAQNYARFFTIEPYMWEFEAMVASGHFEDSIEPPSAFDVVVLIVWSRLGTSLPERTGVREYRGIDGRTPVTGTEWEFEEALHAAQKSGAPDLLVYRSQKPTPVDSRDPQHREQQLQQLRALDEFWERHFANQGMFIGAYTSFTSDAEFAGALEHHLRKLIERRIAALGATPGDTAPKAWAQAPFRGLEAYEFEHAPIFFGQDEALAKAMLQLTGNAEAGSPFLLVLGASGSGKSSLVMAGILPKLFVPRRIPGTAFLRHVVFRPSDAGEGEDLFDALARRLTTQVSEQEGVSELIGPGQSAAMLAAHLRNATAEPGYPIGTALGQLTTQARQSGRMLEYETAKLVLVVDQLEELFTSDRVPLGERLRFVELLASFVRWGLVWVVATMRKDFWHRADETPELVHLSEGNGRLELLPPGPAQLSQMIRRPAEAAGVSFEVHDTTNVPLNEVISEEVAREPGALPLLSYLLDQLYRDDVLEAHGQTLTYATYESLGRLEGAIATKADAVLERCAPEDRQAFSSVLFHLVEMGTAEGDINRAIARRVPLSTFPLGTPQRRLVEALLDPDARLLVSDAEKEGNPTVRVAHEALISRWAQAREFVQRNAEALKIRHRIEERYGLWSGLEDEGQEAIHREAGRTPSPALKLAAWRSRFGREHGLLSDIDLADGRRLLKDHRTDTEPHLIAYIERSISDDKRIRTRSFRVLAIVASLVTLLAIFAFERKHEAEYQSAETLKAQARLLVEAAAQSLKDSDVAGAQGIILEVLRTPDFRSANAPSAINVFQEARAEDAQILALTGHTDRLNSAVFSPDGRRVVTASDDKTARIWDTATGNEIVRMRGHANVVHFAAFSPDGRRVVTASHDKTVRIWDSVTGEELLRLTGHTESVEFAAFSPDGRSLVTASSDHTARTWDASTGQQLVLLKGHTGAVFCASFSPDGRRVATASSDKTARIWDAASGRELMLLSGHTDFVSSAAFAPDNRRLVTASYDRTARIWDGATGQQILLLSNHTGSVNIAEFSPDSRFVLTASDDKTARIWDASTGQQLSLLRGHEHLVNWAGFSPDGRHVVTASADRTARIWDTAADRNMILHFRLADPVTAAVFSPDGKRILTGSYDKTARIWDVATGRQVLSLSGHEGLVVPAAFSADGRRVVTGSYDKTARIWDAVTGQQLLRLTGHTQAVEDAQFSPDGNRVITASSDRTARIWDAATGREVLLLRGHTERVLSAAFSPDSSRVVTASSDKTVRIWDAAMGQQQLLLNGHTDEVASAVFSPDGSRILTASKDKTARVWDAITGRQLMLLSGHSDWVDGATFSRDGQRIVTASNDRTARIWQAATGQQMKVLWGHAGAVGVASFSPDGKLVVTGSEDNLAGIWDARAPAIDVQIAWAEAAQFDPLSSTARFQLGLPARGDVRHWVINRTVCDDSAAAPYDPDRRGPGVMPDQIVTALAIAACMPGNKGAVTKAREVYQYGRAQMASRNLAEARRDFEEAVTEGYHSAYVDLGILLSEPSARMLDVPRAISLYQQAWDHGVPIAAFKLGNLYEYGVRSPDAASTVLLPIDLSKAWSWYQKGADIGEPNALARFAERDEQNAAVESDSSKKNALLLQTFRLYAAAAELARDEDWPDEAWKNWRYRRATLARLLAREGMMQQVADVYTAVRDQRTLHATALWEQIKAKIHW